MQTFIHYFLHFGFPLLMAYGISRKEYLKLYLIFLLTMLVDLDHLVANPIFDPNRCSINFHILHTYWAMGIYVIGLFFQNTRYIAIGLLFHMVTDALDCWMNSL